MAGLTQHEIAPILGVAQTSVGRYLKRAKKKIKAAIEGE
jgi:predicted transcriptional regulator